MIDNFELSGCEFEFTKNVFLPAFIQVWKSTGKKPLIVPLVPTNEEGNLQLFYYPPDLLIEVDHHLKNRITLPAYGE